MTIEHEDASTDTPDEGIEGRMSDEMVAARRELDAIQRKLESTWDVEGGLFEILRAEGAR